MVGLSGGVDSSVTACLLQAKGYDVIGVHMRFWAEDKGENAVSTPENKCCTVAGLTRALFVARKLNIPLLILNFEKEFREKVVDTFIENCQNCLTPNPCIECNRSIKFGLFLDKMKELGADYLATGHYARIKVTGRKMYTLHAAKDPLKDQSYFLYTLTAEKLRQILFPLGGMKKTKVRELAREFGIDEINDQKESQDLCFLPGNETGPFLRKYMKDKRYLKPGPILTAAGRCIGTHGGLPFYTIGQRKRLGIGGIKDMPGQEKNPWYVVKTDGRKNALIVGHETELYSDGAVLRELTFVDGKMPKKDINITAKIRFRAPAVPAVLRIAVSRGKGYRGKRSHGKNPEPRAEIIFQKKQRAVTPGQSVVFYDGDKVLGGGIIV